MVVTVYKNKASGRHFIQAREISPDEAYFITPPDSDGNVRSINLSYKIFHDDPQQEEETPALHKNMTFYYPLITLLFATRREIEGDLVLQRDWYSLSGSIHPEVW